MKLFYALFVLFLLLTGSLAQDAGVKKAYKKKVEQTELTTPPVPIERTPRSTRCNPGFQKVGKECVKVETFSATPQCGAASELTPDSVCATYSGKTGTCPAGFERRGTRCEQRQTGVPTQYCAPGYTLTDEGECTAPIAPPPPVEQCPAGSVLRGDSCMAIEERNPEIGCPPKYTLVGLRCRTEELYNCTPERQATPTSVPPQSPEGVSPTRAPTVQEEAIFAASRPFVASPRLPARPAVNPGRLPTALTRSREQAYVPNSFRRVQSRIHGKDNLPEEFDYVLRAVCKRVRFIPAEKICQEGVLMGKMCRVEVEVPFVAVSAQAASAGGVDIQPPGLQCPDARFELLSPVLCLFVQLQNLSYICPEGTQDIGDRCVTYTPPQMVCPAGTVLENAVDCVLTTTEPEIVEYSVRYSCQGKDCDSAAVMP